MVVVVVVVVVVVDMIFSKVAGSVVIVALLIMTSVVVMPAVASAQQTKVERALTHYKRGKMYFAQRQYEPALKELQQAFILDPNSQLVYNIARVHEEKGDAENAVRYFENYLKMNRRAKNKRDVKRRIKALRKALASAPQNGYLSVSSNPPSASVKVNGALVGNTPLQAAPLAAGRHRITVELDKYETYNADVIVQAGSVTPLNIQLRDQPSSVVITTAPPGAQAMILEPAPRGLGPCNPCVAPLPAGRYKLRVTQTGFQPKEIEFVKRPAETLKLNVTLVSTQSSGQLLVDTNVQGAQVRVNGQLVGQAPMAMPIDLPSGAANIEVMAQGFQPWRRMVQVNSGQLSRVNALLDIIPGPVPITQPEVIYKNTGRTPQWKAGWALIGTGIGLLALGGGSLGIALDAKSTFDNGTYFKDPTDLTGMKLIRQDISQADALDLQSRFDAFYITGLALGGTGAALTLIGAIMAGTAADDNDDFDSLSFGVVPVRGGGVFNVRMSLD